MSIKAKIALAVLLVLVLCYSVAPVSAENQVTIHFFYNELCTHCQDAKLYLEQLAAENPNVSVQSYDVGSDEDDKNLFEEVKKVFKKSAALTPFIVIGGVGLVGFSPQIETDIEELISRYQNQAHVDVVQKLIDGEAVLEEDIEFLRFSPGDYVRLPLLGEVPIDGLSLLVAAIIIGFVDGFNPCAMWVLLFLISLLIGLKNRTRMWLLGLTFLLSSALVYFLIMTAWLNLALSVNDVLWIRIAVGIFAIGYGFYNLVRLLPRIKNKEIGCEVNDDKARKKIMTRITQVVERRNLLFALVGMAVLGVLVNLVELACSTGLPLLYAQILAYNELPSALNYGYLLIYVFFYMLDDLVIFVIAMVTLNLTGISNRYQIPARLIGALIMIALGVLLLFFPKIIMFL
ncbi:MAG: cytochrome c biogenesis protein [Candidatus Izemoplasmatales bacterium]|jgi:thiol-disulfide isomerase/thioredoxin